MTDVQVWGMTRQVASLKSSWPVISICSVEGKIVNILDFASPYVRRRQWHPTPVLLPGKSDGRRSLEGCSPWGRWKLDTTQWLHFHFSLSCIEEGSGNPLQCSCLKNPRDGGAWWAAVYGVAQSRTWLKRLSSSSSSPYITRNNKFPKSFIDEIQSMMIIGLLMRRLDSLGG